MTDNLNLAGLLKGLGLDLDALTLDSGWFGGLVPLLFDDLPQQIAELLGAPAAGAADATVFASSAAADLSATLGADLLPEIWAELTNSF